ncbi:hypothetical protein [Hymenobacter sp. HDW8]|uniref:hypothetical protein n=1 Tax=Hymenobacter sp. HDW8 TaxID=2714932 RepID=UPI00140856AF|nr:hypothetical protein [Hymenobacter sp. HDW8]QIL76255.1 hypothetical protein G7064_10595 [Hymenobacter sp. HDW8]
MSLIRWRLWGAFLLVTFVGCRGQQAAFTFQPPKTKPLAYTSVLADSTSVATAAVSKTRAFYALDVVATSPSSQNKQVMPSSLKPKSLAQRGLPVVQFKKTPSAALANHTTTDRKLLNLALGGLLVVGGVVVGLVLGGWLGLGIGALIVLLGYYFLILGMGGPHAWTEIFQEFFNL